jgi:hypothetical protein
MMRKVNELSDATSFARICPLAMTAASMSIVREQFKHADREKSLYVFFAHTHFELSHSSHWTVCAFGVGGGAAPMDSGSGTGSAKGGASSKKAT